MAARRLRLALALSALAALAAAQQNCTGPLQCWLQRMSIHVPDVRVSNPEAEVVGCARALRGAAATDVGQRCAAYPRAVAAHTHGRTLHISAASASP
jgi:hypothetical protein